MYRFEIQHLLLHSFQGADHQQVYPFKHLKDAAHRRALGRLPYLVGHAFAPFSQGGAHIRAHDGAPLRQRIDQKRQPHLLRDCAGGWTSLSAVVGHFPIAHLHLVIGPPPDQPSHGLLRRFLGREFASPQALPGLCGFLPLLAHPFLKSGSLLLLGLSRPDDQPTLAHPAIAGAQLQGAISLLGERVASAGRQVDFPADAGHNSQMIQPLQSHR